MMTNVAPADDLMRGAQPIGDFLFDDQDPIVRRRRVYHLWETMKGDDRPPLFKLGATLCARRSRLLAWLDDRESSARRPKDVRAA